MPDPVTLAGATVRVVTPPILDLLLASRREAKSIVVELIPTKVSVSAVTCTVRVWNPRHRKGHRGGNSILGVRIVKTHGDSGSVRSEHFHAGQNEQTGIVRPGEVVEKEIGWKQDPVVRLAVGYAVTGGAVYERTFKDPFPGRRGPLRRIDERGLLPRVKRLARWPSGK